MFNGRISTKELVYFEIKEKIISGELQPNQSVNEERLAKDFDVSRTPLREALQRLEFEELIVRKANGRLKIAPISIKEAKEIFEIRSLLEGLVTREATIKVTDQNLQELKDITKLIVSAANDGRGEDVVRYGSEFHSFLYEWSDNQTAIKILYQLNDHISRYRRLGPIRSSGRSKAAAEEHQQLYELISGRNPEGAEEAMVDHIKNSLESAIQSIEIILQKNKVGEE